MGSLALKTPSFGGPLRNRIPVNPGEIDLAGGGYRGFLRFLIDFQNRLLTGPLKPPKTWGPLNNMLIRGEATLRSFPVARNGRDLRLFVFL